MSNSFAFIVLNMASSPGRIARDGKIAALYVYLDSPPT
jgi:hypothetical protein